MDFGICVAAKVDYITHAENLGYFHAWVADSQMIWSDCYAVLALAAEQTRRIKLGTGVSVSGTRIAPVTANSIATITRLAPGRTFLGIGAARVERSLNNFYTCSLTAVVVLKLGESVTSERVLNECGAFAIGSLHYAYDKVRQMGGAPPAHLRDCWEEYCAMVEAVPARQRHRRVHARRVARTGAGAGSGGAQAAHDPALARSPVPRHRRLRARGH